MRLLASAHQYKLDQVAIVHPRCPAAVGIVPNQLPLINIDLPPYSRASCIGIRIVTCRNAGQGCSAAREQCNFERCADIDFARQLFKVSVPV